MIEHTDINKFLNRFKNLILDSKNEWIKIEKENSTRKALLTEFLIPFSLLCGIIAFTGSIIDDKLYTSITIFIVTIISIYAGIYSSILIFKEVSTSNKNLPIGAGEKIIIYSSAIYFLFHAIAYFFNEGSTLRAILQLAQFLCVIPIWGGIEPILRIPKANKIGYTVFIVLLITILPTLFDKLFSIILEVPVATI